MSRVAIILLLVSYILASQDLGAAHAEDSQTQETKVSAKEDAGAEDTAKKDAAAGKEKSESDSPSTAIGSKAAKPKHIALLKDAERISGLIPLYKKENKLILN